MDHLQCTAPEARHRVQFVDLSVHNSLAVLLDRPTAPPLHGVTIQFPDPWAKTKTKRRRILQPDLASLVVGRLERDGFLYFSTDCAGVARDMELVMEPHCSSGALRRAVFESPVCGSLESDGPGESGVPPTRIVASRNTALLWLPFNPFGVPSERERVCGELGRPVYRALYWKQ